eukprot:7709626-Alexandrium_andersonii.AAC.1
MPQVKCASQRPNSEGNSRRSEGTNSRRNSAEGAPRTLYRSLRGPGGFAGQPPLNCAAVIAPWTVS